MARYSASARAAGAGSTTLPSGSLYSIASRQPKLRQVEVWNTSDVDVAIRLVRLTTAGTQGGAITPTKYDDASADAFATPRNTHTVAPTITTEICRTVLGAAKGSGVMWVFGETGIVIPAGTGNGVGIVVSAGTGQILDFVFHWDE